WERPVAVDPATVSGDQLDHRDPVSVPEDEGLQPVGRARRRDAAERRHLGVGGAAGGGRRGPEEERPERREKRRREGDGERPAVVSDSSHTPYTREPEREVPVPRLASCPGSSASP